MGSQLERLTAFAITCVVLQAARPVHGEWNAFRRSLPQHGGASDWTRKAQRNLSRWESRLLQNTLRWHYSSHVLGQVPFDLYDPVVTCPPPSKLMRLDPDGLKENPTKWVDGSKWMCVPFPRTARPGCVVLSFGSNDQFEFERAALDMTPCTVHTLDCTTGMLGNATHFKSIDPARHSFHPYCVGGRDMAAKNPMQVLTWEGILRAVRPQATVPVRQQYGGGAGRALARLPDSGERGGGGVPTRQRQISVAASGAEAATTSVDVIELEDKAQGHQWSGQQRRRDYGYGDDGSSGTVRRLGFWGGAEGGASGGGGRRRRDVGPEVFLLKIDVEGYEWQLLSEWGPNTPGLPAFLAIEIHNWLEELSPAAAPPPPPPARSPGLLDGLHWWLFGRRAAARAGDPEAAARRAAAAAAFARRQRVYSGELSLLFLHLARLGYAVVARENNPNGDFEAKLCCAEFLFIRVRGPEEGRPGMWDWTNWFAGFKEGLGLMRGAPRRQLLQLR